MIFEVSVLTAPEEIKSPDRKSEIVRRLREEGRIGEHERGGRRRHRAAERAAGDGHGG